MASVFISYAREDRQTAQALAKLIEAQGLDVWWDRELVPGEAYADIIEGELDQAMAVIVLWSQHSRNSYWVRDEAAVGRDRNRLVPIQLDEKLPPLGFRQIHTADLSRWDGQNEAALETIYMSLDGLCGGRCAPTAAPDFPAQSAPQAPPRPAPAPGSAPHHSRGVIVTGVNAQPNQKSLKSILKGEKRQRGFIRTFWMTSFIVSGALALVLGVLFGETKGNIEYGRGIVAFGSFVVLGVGLILGRFLIVIGRRLSKRKSVRYFDIPTLICLGLSFLLGLTVLAAEDNESLADAISMIPLAAAIMFPIFAFWSIPIGFVRGLGRKTFEDGR